MNSEKTEGGGRDRELPLVLLAKIWSTTKEEGDGEENDQEEVDQKESSQERRKKFLRWLSQKPEVLVFTMRKVGGQELWWKTSTPAATLKEGAKFCWSPDVS